MRVTIARCPTCESKSKAMLPPDGCPDEWHLTPPPGFSVKGFISGTTLRRVTQARERETPVERTVRTLLAPRVRVQPPYPPPEKEPPAWSEPAAWSFNIKYMEMQNNFDPFNSDYANVKLRNYANINPWE